MPREPSRRDKTSHIQTSHTLNIHHIFNIQINLCKLFMFIYYDYVRVEREVMLTKQIDEDRSTLTAVPLIRSVEAVGDTVTPVRSWDAGTVRTGELRSGARPASCQWRSKRHFSYELCRVVFVPTARARPFAFYTAGRTSDISRFSDVKEITSPYITES